MRRRIFAILLALTTLFSLASIVSAVSITDMEDMTDTTQWYYNDVAYVLDNGIMNGCTEYTSKYISSPRARPGYFIQVEHHYFYPNASLTRAEVAQIFYNLMKCPSVSGKTEPFNDVDSSKWYYNAVTWAYNEGIVNGESATTFKPNAAITREEFCVMAWKFYCFEICPKLVKAGKLSNSPYFNKNTYATERAKNMAGDESGQAYKDAIKSKFNIRDASAINRWAIFEVYRQMGPDYNLNHAKYTWNMCGTDTGNFFPQQSLKRSQVAKLLRTFHSNFKDYLP